MGDLVGHGPGRVTACSLSGEGRKVNPCTTTRAREENMAAEAKRCSETQWNQQDVKESQLSGSAFFQRKSVFPRSHSKYSKSRGQTGSTREASCSLLYINKSTSLLNNFFFA